MQQMKMTCYADGESCPGECDSHVVFKPQHNSSPGVLRNAYKAGTRRNPAACRWGEDCTICFSSNPTDCVTTKYRGNGPPEGKFDVTPDFLKEHCFKPGTRSVKSGLPKVLENECRRVLQGAQVFERRINCIADPEHPKCLTLMRQKQAEWNADRAEYEECLRIGETRFNEKRPREKQRKFECAYSKYSDPRTGFSHLLPGACKPGTYLSGGYFDCCSADTLESSCSGYCSEYFKAAD